MEILAGNYMFSYDKSGKWRATRIGDVGGLIFAGRFIKDSRCPQVVIAPGDGVGSGQVVRVQRRPVRDENWVGARPGRPRPMIHPHSLQVADIDGDGNLDIFVAEMAKWTESRQGPGQSRATGVHLLRRRKGNFRETVFQTGMGFHEARVADLNGDGRLDILSKPYNWETPRVDIWLNRGPGPGIEGAEALDSDSMMLVQSRAGVPVASTASELPSPVTTLSDVSRPPYQGRTALQSIRAAQRRASNGESEGNSMAKTTADVLVRAAGRLGRGHGLRPARRRDQRLHGGAAEEPGEDPLHPGPARGGGGLHGLRLRQVHRAAGRLLRHQRPRRDPPPQRPLRRQDGRRPGAGDHRPDLPRPDRHALPAGGRTSSASSRTSPSSTSRSSGPSTPTRLVDAACRAALSSRGVAHLTCPQRLAGA